MVMVMVMELIQTHCWRAALTRAGYQSADRRHVYSIDVEGHGRVTVTVYYRGRRIRQFETAGDGLAEGEAAARAHLAALAGHEGRDDG